MARGNPVFVRIAPPPTALGLTMTMKYAHLAPDLLQEVVKLNPLTALTLR
jgi:hypothetical protein